MRRHDCSTLRKSIVNLHLSTFRPRARAAWTVVYPFAKAITAARSRISFLNGTIWCIATSGRTLWPVCIRPTISLNLLAGYAQPLARALVFWALPTQRSPLKTSKLPLSIEALPKVGSCRNLQPNALAKKLRLSAQDPAVYRLPRS